MSTRCQIEFKKAYSFKQKNGKIKKDEESVLLYRHSDGYPDSVIPDLKEFLKWNGGRTTDIEFTAANFIYWSKRYYEEFYYHQPFGGGIDEKGRKAKWSDPQGFNSTLLLGFGICEKDDFHADIEYFYEVIVEVEQGTLEKNTTIKVYEIDHEEEIVERKNFRLIDTIVVGRQ